MFNSLIELVYLVGDTIDKINYRLIDETVECIEHYDIDNLYKAAKILKHLDNLRLAHADLAGEVDRFNESSTFFVDDTEDNTEQDDEIQDDEDDLYTKGYWDGYETARNQYYEDEHQKDIYFYGDDDDKDDTYYEDEDYGITSEEQEEQIENNTEQDRKQQDNEDETEQVLNFGTKGLDGLAEFLGVDSSHLYKDMKRIGFPTPEDLEHEMSNTFTVTNFSNIVASCTEDTETGEVIVHGGSMISADESKTILKESKANRNYIQVNGYGVNIGDPNDGGVIRTKIDVTLSNLNAALQFIFGTRYSNIERFIVKDKKSME